MAFFVFGKISIHLLPDDTVESRLLLFPLLLYIMLIAFSYENIASIADDFTAFLI